MTEDILFVDDAVDILRRRPDELRFLTPHGDFTVKDPADVVGRVTERCRHGASQRDVLETFPMSVERAAAESALGLLERRRVLTPHPAPSGRRADPLVSWLRHLAGAGAAPPLAASLHVAGDGLLAAKLRGRACEFGFDLVDDMDHASGPALVAAFDVPDMEQLRSLNARAQQRGQVFLPVWLERAVLNWGPMTTPKATGCLECLSHRQEAARRREPQPTVIGDTGLTVSGVAAELGAIFALGELFRWAHNAHLDTDLGMVWRFDLLELSFEGSRVLRLPRCTTCGV